MLIIPIQYLINKAPICLNALQCPSTHLCMCPLKALPYAWPWLECPTNRGVLIQLCAVLSLHGSIWMVFRGEDGVETLETSLNIHSSSVDLEHSWSISMGAHAHLSFKSTSFHPLRCSIHVHVRVSFSVLKLFDGSDSHRSCWVGVACSRAPQQCWTWIEQTYIERSGSTTNLTGCQTKATWRKPGMSRDHMGAAARMGFSADKRNPE